jgi:hypothetical protein
MVVPIQLKPSGAPSYITRRQGNNSKYVKETTNNVFLAQETKETMRSAKYNEHTITTLQVFDHIKLQIVELCRQGLANEDHCAAYCRLSYESHLKCNVFSFASDGTCYIGNLQHAGSERVPAGTSDVYYDKGTYLLFISNFLFSRPTDQLHNA